MRNKVMLLVGAAALVASTAFAGPGDWAFWGKFDTPLNNSGLKTAAATRIGMDTNGNAYIAHYGDGQTQAHLVKFVPPSGDTLTLPVYTRVVDYYCTRTLNGVMGMTPDSVGGMYYAIDIGANEVNHIGRVNADGTTDTAFRIDNTTRRVNAITADSDGNLVVWPLLGGSAVWHFNGSTAAQLADIPVTLAGNIRDAQRVNAGGVDKYFLNRSGNLMRVDLATGIVDAGLVDASDNPITVADVGGAGGYGVGYFPKDGTLIYCTHDNLATSARSNIYVIDPATRRAVQVIDGLEQVEGVAQAIKPADAICYTVGAFDYMVVLQSGNPAASVFRKPTTPPAAVAEWSLY